MSTTNRPPTIPRMPFASPILHRSAAKQPPCDSRKNAIKTLPSRPDQFLKPKPIRSTTAPQLSVTTDFDPPRTPPVFRLSFGHVRSHRRQESLQERRKRAKAEGNNSVDYDHDFLVSPGGKTANAGLQLGEQRILRAKHLSIAPSIDCVITPITPSIIVVPPLDQHSHVSTSRLNFIDNRRSSIYSQATHLARQPSQVPQRWDAEPPIPAIPHDILRLSYDHDDAKSRAVSWTTDIEEDDDETCVEAAPENGDCELLVIKRGSINSMATPGSKGWWDHIRTPFLFGRNSPDMARKPSISSMSRAAQSPETEPVTTPEHQTEVAVRTDVSEIIDLDEVDRGSEAAKTNRGTMAFFATSPDPVVQHFSGLVRGGSLNTPETALSPKHVLSPDFVDAGGFGEAAEYFEACWHDANSPDPFYKCVNHDCHKHGTPAPEPDREQKAAFLASLPDANNPSASTDLEATTGALADDATEGVEESPPSQPVSAPGNAIGEDAETSRNAHDDMLSPPAVSMTPRPGMANRADTEMTLDDIRSIPEVAQAQECRIIQARSPMPTRVPYPRSVANGSSIGESPVLTIPGTIAQSPRPGQLPYPSSSTDDPVRDSFTALTMPSSGRSLGTSVEPTNTTPPLGSATAVHCQRSLPAFSDASRSPSLIGGSSQRGFLRPPPLYAHREIHEPASPEVMTPGLAHHVNIGRAVPMQDEASVTRLGRFEQHGDLPASVSLASSTPGGREMVKERGDDPLAPKPDPYDQWMNEKDPSEKYGAAKEPGMFAKLTSAFSIKRTFRQESSANRKQQRICYLIFSGLVAMILLILVLIMTISIVKQDIPAQGAWVNLTDFPAIPTGISTIAGTVPVYEANGCVSPSSMWSCAIPPEQQSLIAPNEPFQPNFRLEIRFKNGTKFANGTTVTKRQTGGVYDVRRVMQKSVLKTRDAWFDQLYGANPAPPSQADQVFLGNTTDNATTPFEGEQTPFFISLLPLVAAASNTVLRRDVSQNATATSNASLPSPVSNSDGTAASATLYPLPSAQPLKLYNRNQDDEYYGFYSYFDRSIFLSSNAQRNSSLTVNSTDPTGGVNETSAVMRCTWAQTRFIVKIWTRSRGKLLGSNGTLSNATLPSSGTLTQNSAFDFGQPGSFPYPATISIDRHGGDGSKKMVYCYGMDGKQKIISSEKYVIQEDRGFGGSLINPVLSAASPTTTATAASAGGIDGGTGGCGCSWQNWS